MDNKKTPSYYVKKMINDIEFAISHTENVTLREFCDDEVLNSAISFKFVQISENAKKIPDWMIMKYKSIPWNKLSGLRNKIVHDYGSIQFEIIYDTIKNDLPVLVDKLNDLINE